MLNWFSRIGSGCLVSVTIAPTLLRERPFPGLRPFGAADHQLFFGRESQVYALYRLIDRSTFVAVVGDSGSGKSSLVRAGLLPLLESETHDSGGRAWRFVDMRPGTAPIAQLAGALSRLSIAEGEPGLASARRERVAFRLRQSSFGVIDALAEIEDVGDGPFLLIIDQFEELFRYPDAGSGEAAAHFVQLLLEASHGGKYDVRVLLTMRSDFIGDCARFHGLPEAVSASQFLVPSLTRDQVEEVILGPIKAARGFIEPSLVQRLLNDREDGADQLPVLQHCLMRLWDRAAHSNGAGPDQVRLLDMAGYSEIGGMRLALSHHADEILADIGSDQETVEFVFRALSDLDRDGRASRRPCRFAQLLQEIGLPEANLRRVIDRFRADDCAFLSPSLSVMPILAHDTVIDIAHEALLRRWERMWGNGVSQGWLAAEQQDGLRYRGLLAHAHIGSEAGIRSTEVENWWTWWMSRPRTPGWAERYGGGFEEVVSLLDRSSARRRGMRLARWAGAIAAVIALIAMLIAGYQFCQRSCDRSQIEGLK